MNYDLNAVHGYQNTMSLAMRNRVLRNTYWLLALSLIPTVIGAALGVQFQFAASVLGHGWVGSLFFFAIAFGLIMGIQANRNSSLGVVLLLVFTFFMGVMLSGILSWVLRFSNGTELIMLAFGGTSVIFGVMASIATVSKRDFSGMGKWLMVGLVMIIIAGIANLFLQLSALVVTISVISMGIFSAFMLYDVQRVVNGGEMNYITATLNIYLDIYNVFVSLLQILGIFGGNRD